MRGRFLLEKVLQGKIKSLREAARRQGYQTSLFAQNAPVEVSFEYGLAFGPSTYEPRSFYPGRPYVFRNHFYPQVGEPKNIGEEFECAKLLDMHPKVKFWVRNIERSQHSFRLPTSTDYFYPDFVAKLTDDRILVVEYKGEFLRGTPDTEEKISIGALWASKSKGKGLFLKAWKKDDKDRPLSQQISDTIAC
jgi:type III restriction enzyme